MPYHKESHHPQCPTSKPIAVVKDDDGKVMGCHPSDAAADAQLAALYANEKTMDISTMTFAIPARVRHSVVARQADLLALVKERVPDPAYLDEHDPFFWAAEISSDVIDSYFTWMMASTLINFAADAKAGVAFLPGHQHRELPFGYSLDSLMENAINPERTRVVADFYTVPGLKLNDIETDHLIRGIRSGLIRDVSVGFHGGETRCSICGRDMWDWDCPHIPGLNYEVKDGNTVRTVLATFGVDGAHLSEVSAVFDGATPRAEVLKAEREAAEGRMKPDAVRMIEERYRVKLPVKRQFAGVDTPGRKQIMDLEQQIRELLGLSAEENVVDGLQAAIRNLKQETSVAVTEFQKAQARIKELEPLAADGAQYRADLVAEALAEGVRAYGDKFDSKTYEDMLRTAPLATIKRMKTDWATIGDGRFSGGRKTTDTGEPAPNGQQRKPISVPATAHKV